MRLYTKTFIETRYLVRPPGAAPGVWVGYRPGPVNDPLEPSATVDELVAAWVQATGAELVATSAPTLHMDYVDEACAMRVVNVLLTVIYRAYEAEHDGDRDPFDGVFD